MQMTPHKRCGMLGAIQENSDLLSLLALEADNKLRLSALEAGNGFTVSMEKDLWIYLGTRPSSEQHRRWPAGADIVTPARNILASNTSWM